MYKTGALLFLFANSRFQEQTLSEAAIACVRIAVTLKTQEVNERFIDECDILITAIADRTKHVTGSPAPTLAPSLPPPIPHESTRGNPHTCALLCRVVSILFNSSSAMLTRTHALSSAPLPSVYALVFDCVRTNGYFISPSHSSTHT